MPRTVIVIPCYNEARVLAPERFVRFAIDHPAIRFLFVDDGSTDGTRAVLQGLVAQAPDSFSMLSLFVNEGKAAAVRTGVWNALAANPDFVGYFDADLAASLDELPRMLGVMEQQPATQIVMGVRARHLGTRIERGRVRQVMGRLFAVAASWALGVGFHDTQCGAKLLRVTPEAVAVFKEPFDSRWLVDLEILWRFLGDTRGKQRKRAAEAIVELPLRTWIDGPESKVHPGDLMRSGRDLWRLHRRYR